MKYLVCLLFGLIALNSVSARGGRGKGKGGGGKGPGPFGPGNVTPDYATPPPNWSAGPDGPNGPDGPDGPRGPGGKKLMMAEIIVDALAHRMMTIRDCADTKLAQERDEDDVFETVAIVGKFLLHGCSDDDRTPPPPPATPPATPPTPTGGPTDPPPARSLDTLLARELESYFKRKRQH